MGKHTGKQETWSTPNSPGLSIDHQTPDANHNPENSLDAKHSHGANHTEDAYWHCCRCNFIQPIFPRAGRHPLGALACQCPHKPCGSCVTSGLVKLFVPMEEPAIVPLAEDTDEIRFGTICSSCGLSWRAEEVGHWTKQLIKMASFSQLSRKPSLSLQKLHQARLAPGTFSLRRSNSVSVLHKKRVITPPGLGKQAKYSKVQFSGMTCTCDHVIDLGSFCFQIISPQVDEYTALVTTARKDVGWSTTPELQAMGHGKPMIQRAGISHPNPLQSNPITESNIM